MSRGMRGIVQTLNWYAMGKIASSLASSILQEKEVDGNILYIVPHADDELLSGYYLLQRLGTKAYIYYCGMTGSNRNPINKQERDKEIRQLCTEKGMNLLLPKNWEDEIVNTVNGCNISTIILPSYIDWHVEHRLINTTILDIYNSLPKEISLLWYSVTVPIVDTHAILFPASRMEQKEKYYSFRTYYESQRNMPVERLMIQERINAKLIDAYAAEIFLNVSIDQQTEWIKKQRKREGDYFLIALNNDGERIGVLSVYDIDDKNAEIGRVVMQGKSCESLEAWLLLLEFSFDTLNLCEVSAYVNPDNARAIRFCKFFGGTAVKNSTAVRNFPFIEMSFNAVSFLEHKQEVIQKILLN